MLDYVMESTTPCMSFNIFLICVCVMYMQCRTNLVVVIYSYTAVAWRGREGGGELRILGLL